MFSLFVVLYGHVTGGGVVGIEDHAVGFDTPCGDGVMEVEALRVPVHRVSSDEDHEAGDDLIGVEVNFDLVAE